LTTLKPRLIGVLDYDSIIEYMRFDVITIFPKIFDSYLKESILKRAQKNKLIEIKIWNLRDFSKNKHKKVDDKAYGGGPGMVMQIEPIIRAVQFAKSKIPASPAGRKNQKSRVKVVLFSAAGKQFDNKTASDLAKKYDYLILICGRYEGIDERIKKIVHSLGFKVQELSVGPYVLTGGEIPAMVLIDAVSRHLPGVLGKYRSLEEERYGIGVPAYTRPEVIKFPLPRRGKKNKKYKVPSVLLSGDHRKIEEWRKRNKKGF